jgi:hypothetical protein
LAAGFAAAFLAAGFAAAFLAAGFAFVVPLPFAIASFSFQFSNNAPSTRYCIEVSLVYKA